MTETTANNENTNSSPTIIVLEDDPFSSRLICACFEDLDIQTIICDNPMQVIQRLKQSESIKLVITDYMLENQSAVDLMKLLEKFDFQSIPVICISGYSFKSLPKEYKTLFPIWFNKPFNPEELINKVLELLQISKT